MLTLTEIERKTLIDLANEARPSGLCALFKLSSRCGTADAVRTDFHWLQRGERRLSHQACAQSGVAIFKAVSDGEKEFDVIAVATPNGGSPCGGCRQVMAEFGLDTIVLISDGKGHLVPGDHRCWFASGCVSRQRI